MNEQLQKQLIRQLKLLNFWITIFGTLVLAGLAIIGYFLFQTAMFVKQQSDNVQNLRDTASNTLNVNKQVCQGTGAMSDYIKNNTSFCKESKSN
jgi:hypothetical protein